MNIGIDIRLINETGVGRYIKNLITNIVKLDKANNYTLFGNSSSLKSVPDHPRWHLLPVNIHWHSLKEQYKLFTILNRLNLDLIHFPYFSYPVLYHKKFITTIHDVTHLTHATGKASTLPQALYLMKQLAFRYVLNQALTHSCAVIVPSNTVKSKLLTLMPNIADKINVTYEGLLSSHITDKIQDKSEKKYLLYIGNVYPHKNAEIIIKLLSKLASQKNSPLHNLPYIFVVKNDHFSRELKRYSQQQGVSKQITWLTDITDHKLSSLYQNALCLVAPSHSEGFGLTLVEALQHRCPVVCSDLTIFHEIIENYPFYFNPDDVESLKCALEKVIRETDKDRSKNYENNKYLLKRYSWEKMTQKTLQIYASCLT